MDDLAGIGDEDIRRITDSIMGELDRVEAEAEIVSTRLQNQVEDAIGQSEIEIQLEERRKRLGIEDA